MSQNFLLKQSFRTIVSNHLTVYPDLMVDDLYKLIFQAAMGNEHAVTDPDLVLDRLRAEADALKPSRGAPLIMPLSPDHRLVRVDIRPYLDTGGDLGNLGRAFIQTSQRFNPSVKRLVRYWSWAESMAMGGDLPMSPAKLRGYFEQRRSQGYPAVHHSAKYRRLYQPAYRVVINHLIAIPQE